LTRSQGTGRRRGSGPRRRAQRGPSLVGRRYDVDVGPVAHGGHCVARLPAALPDVGGTVVFVRHALPDEQVRVEITEGAVGDKFLRADAVEVRRASPDRVVPPCPFAGPGRCGGCDLQHVSVDAQLRWKADVVAEQLRRVAGLERAVVVERVPGDLDGLAWRTRMRFHRLPDGTVGLRAHRSHRVVPVDACLIQAPGAQVVVEDEDASPPPGSLVERVERVDQQHLFEVPPDGFWQVHRGAPAVLVQAVLEGAAVQPGHRALDLYSGVGLFAAFLAEKVGAEGRVLAVEGHAEAAAHAQRNLSAYPWVRSTCGAVERVLTALPEEDRHPDVVVLDPPRDGARRQVVEAVAGLAPPRVVHVACDPAAFARDVSLFAEGGYGLESLRAFDLFPMTQHVEVVGVLTRR
jgi:tRNA/tmRNA/rRNA uracil-C5-methylase (TrmA/RlmC/RlmD family)